MNPVITKIARVLGRGLLVLARGICHVVLWPLRRYGVIEELLAVFLTACVIVAIRTWA